MFELILCVLLLVWNFLLASRAIAQTDAGCGPGVLTVPLRGRARHVALTLLLSLVPAGANAQSAYITNDGDGTVSVIATATNTVVATAPVVSCCVRGVAVTPDGTKVYLTVPLGDAVPVIDTATNKVITTISVALPGAVAVTPDGMKAYVSSPFFNTVSVIDTATNKVTTTIPVGAGPSGVAVSPDGALAYVTAGGTVSVIDTATNTVTATIPVGVNPFGVAVTPDGTKAYVADYTDNTVSVINTATNKVTTTIPVGVKPFGVAVTPDGTKAYVANSGANTVSVIATATNTVAATIPVGVKPSGVAVTPDDAKAYVANSGSNTVSVIDTASNMVVATIPVGRGPVAFGKFIGGTCGTDSTIFFGNGVLVSRPSAFDELTQLAIALSSVLPPEEFQKICFRLAYNTTTGLNDLYEAYLQTPLGRTGSSLFWQALASPTNQGFVSPLILHEAKALLDKTKMLESQDLSVHVAAYKATILGGGKAIVVAHSQGNFFANESFAKLELPEQSSFGIVAVANPDYFVATDVARGGDHHVTISGFVPDRVIAGLIAFQKASGVPLDRQAQPPNVVNDSVPGDFTGHYFVESYLFPNSASRIVILGDIVNVRNGLRQPAP